MKTLHRTSFLVTKLTWVRKFGHSRYIGNDMDVVFWDSLSIKWSKSGFKTDLSCTTMDTKFPGTSNQSKI